MQREKGKKYRIMSGLLTLIAERDFALVSPLPRPNPRGKSRIRRPSAARACNMMYDMSAKNTNTAQTGCQMDWRTEGSDEQKERRTQRRDVWRAMKRPANLATVWLSVCIIPFLLISGRTFCQSLAAGGKAFESDTRTILFIPSTPFCPMYTMYLWFHRGEYCSGD